MEKAKTVQHGKYVYKISLMTQIGIKTGQLLLTVAGRKIEGMMEILGQKQPCKGRITDSGECVLRGQLKTLISVFDYTAKGIFDEQCIQLILQYRKGILHLTGERLV